MTTVRAATPGRGTAAKPPANYGAGIPAPANRTPSAAALGAAIVFDLSAMARKQLAGLVTPSAPGTAKTTRSAPSFDRLV